MSCKVCGSDTPVLEAAPLNDDGCPSCNTCSTCNLPASSCSCKCSSTSPCQEDHTKTIVSKRFSYSLRAAVPFNWPEPFESVTFRADSVERLTIGSLLYTPNAGYLHVTGFDCATQEVTAQNLNEVCNTYEGGELLPACTDFAVGPPACNTGNEPIPNVPYLAADFTAPADGDCQLASVTNIIGLVVNDTISINGYQYRLADIPDSETVQLCNDGDGAPTGTVIPWDSDGDEVPNIPLIIIASENPCARDPVSAGSLLVCVSGVAQPLEGSVGGQIPVWNNVTERFELKNISAPYTVCTSLTADLVADSGHVGSYAVLVVDTSAFLALDFVLIDGLFYQVNVVDNATTMHITPVETPIGIITYPAGTPVCLANDQYILYQLQNVSASRLLGRGTSGAGPVQEITASSGLEWTATGIRREALTGDVTAAVGSNATTLSNDVASRSALLGNLYCDHTSASAVNAIRLEVAAWAQEICLMPKPGKLTHMGVVTDQVVATGDIRGELFKNGVTTGLTLTLAAGNLRVSAAIGPVTFAAQDYFNINVTSTHTPDPLKAIFDLWGYFNN